MEQVYVLAADATAFKKYCEENRLVPGRDAVFIANEWTLRGRRGPLTVVTAGDVDRRPDLPRINELLAQINLSAASQIAAGLNPTDVKLFGAVRQGDSVQANGRTFTVSDISTDIEGCQQWTLAVPGSACANGPANRTVDSQETHVL